jgi:Phospholipase_D-nuclease N-terminal
MFGVLGLGGGELILILFLLPLSLLAMAFWIWMLIHAIQNKGLSDGEKVGWVLVIALLHFLGALIYFFVGRPKQSAVRPAQPPVMT